MKKNYFFYSAVTVITLFALQLVNAQTTYDWLDTAPDNNWRQGASGARWSGGLFDEPPFGILRFNNNHELNMNNNVSGGYTFHKMVFGSFNTNDRIISGNDLFFFDFSGTDPEIENLSTGSHTINCNIIGDDNGDPLIIDAQSGNITLNGTLNNNSSFIDVSGNGGHNVIISGVISGNGGIALKDNTILTLSGNNTYTGATILEGGTLILQNNVANSSFTVQSGTSLEIDASLTVNSIAVEAGGYLQVNSGATLTATNGITLRSSSTSYSSLIVDGSISGTVAYERFVNSSTGGNDLIASPLSGESWADFLSSGTNASDLLDDGNVGPTTYAFAPFDKSVSNYMNYDSNTSTTIGSGTGYRTATDAGTTLTFSGSVLTGTVAINIIDSGTSFADWNLIGNPYPSYVDIKSFLEHEVATGVSNISLFESASGIYGYDGDVSDGWDIITLVNDDGKFLAPGQGFFVAADAGDVAAYDVEFTAAMRSTGNSDDFITGRTNNTLTFANINISTASNSYNTEIYFDANASLGLDPGYDAAIFGGSAPSFSIYSHLVQDNTGIPIALQAVGLTDVSDVTIPLGVNANASEELTFDMSPFTLPPNINVYLDDTVANVSTLLNTGNYVLTPSANLTGTGRFFLRFTDSALSIPEHSFDAISIYTDQNAKTINISGYLVNDTTANIYDIQGRLVTAKKLDISVNLQSIDMSSFTTGIYIVELSDNSQSRVEKVILP